MRRSGARGPLKLKVDLHVHTSSSSDAFTSPFDLPRLCKQAGIDGVAITDHNKVAGCLPDGIVVLHGIEVTSTAGHIIGLGVHDPIERGLSPEETIRRIRAQGGLAVLPHPYDLLRAGVRPESLKIFPDAVEVINGTSVLARLTWPPAERFAEAHRIPRVAGSDSHIPETLGRAYTIIESDLADEDSIIEAIRSGRTSPAGKQVTVGMRVRKSFLQLRRSL